MPIDLEHRPANIDAHMLNGYILASVPALLVGVWVIGQGIAGTAGASAGVPGQAAVLQSVLLGAGWIVPRLAVAALVSLCWAALFARSRRRAMDPGWLFAAWLFALLLPAGTPLPMVAIGMSFGLVFGCHVFGGTGCYIVNPALLGAVFLSVAYPQSMAGNWVPGSEAASTWSIVATGGPDALAAEGLRWLDFALGREIAAIGVPSAAACLAGMVLLLAKGLASRRVVAGALIGLLAAAASFGTLPWHVQPVLGSFAFALAFIAGDPTTIPETRIGRWSFGVLFGVLTVVLRTLNPEHPEGSLYALLLASLATPLIDHAAQGRQDRMLASNDSG